MNAFLHALTFMTRIPVRFPMKPEEWKNSAPYYPLVGLIVGVFIYLFSISALFLFPTIVAAILVVTGWVWITGGLHMDGLMDTADGIGSSRSRSSMLEIMKDSRVGAMGVLASTVLLLCKGASVYAILESTYGITLAACLLLPPVLARTGILYAMTAWPYLHKEDNGLASELITGVTSKKRMAAFLGSCLLTILLAGPWLGLLLLVLWLCFTYVFNRMITGKLGGLSGDTYGALVECSEAFLLLVGTGYVHHGGITAWPHLFG